jgi:ADP-ribose pyrophosphatase
MDVPQVLTSREMFEGPVFSVRSDAVRLSDGREVRLDVAVHGPSFAIVASPRPGEIVLVRQYRHAAGKWMWEIPAGSAEPGEDPALGASRELAEETGYRARGVREIARFYPTPGFCSETLVLFAAEAAERGEQSLDPDEQIDVHVVTVDALETMVRRGDIDDGKTLLAYLWLRAGVSLLS